MSARPMASICCSPPGEIAGLLAVAFLEARKVAVDEVDALFHLRLVTLHMTAGDQILISRQVLEHTAALEHLGNAEARDIEGTHAVDAPLTERYGALRNLAPLGAQNA